MHTWSILILNVYRYKLLEKLSSPNDQTNDKNSSKINLLFSIVIMSVFSTAYAVNLWVNKFSDSTNTIIRVLNFLGKDVAFMISIILNIVTIAGLHKVQRRRYNSIRPLARTSTFPNDPKSSILLRQFMLSLIFQAIFYIVPGILRMTSEFINLDCALKMDSNVLYSFSETLLVLFTPCAFGILVEPRRGYLLELFCLQKSSEGVTNVSTEIRNTQNIGETPGQWNCRTIQLPEIANNLAQSTEIPLDVTTIMTDTKTQGRDVKRQYQGRQYFTDINMKNGPPMAYSLKRYIKKKQSTDMSVISYQSETSLFGSFSDISSIQGTILIPGMQVSLLDTNQRRGRSISTVIQRPPSFPTLMQRPSSIADVLSII